MEEFEPIGKFSASEGQTICYARNSSTFSIDLGGLMYTSILNILPPSYDLCLITKFVLITLLTEKSTKAFPSLFHVL